MSDSSLFPLDGRKNRGTLMTPSEIRSSIFADGVSEWWIRRNVAPLDKITLGRSTVMWYDRDVYRWIDERKGR